MSEWPELTKLSRQKWEENAAFWDDYMGDESNAFHRELIKPATVKLLQAERNDRILDIGCGNGNFSRTLAECGAKVTAADYSGTMIERARIRTTADICYLKMDATNYDALTDLGIDTYDKAVSNMALMDMANIEPLVKGLSVLLKKDGLFVFSIVHPCFQVPDVRKVTETVDRDGKVFTTHSIQLSKYIQKEQYEAVAVNGQPTPHLMFHRPLSYYVNLFSQYGFVLENLAEPTFEGTESDSFEWIRIPPTLIFRFRKV
ncbi:Methyltransferase domain-containing protein [Gracilibacillus ureilyticus]|uniref:Methyltransferase domain-containing protein n=1 Tax=Gracilibacillus ureilyticus TaxID=531814 RepID=A0A1H9RSA9_9BACI|nr:class I SAM-dependent methyltransferase [Gracilibacillus ureilyticus]SER75596.1 Methyltransferase domain-containing protein [Gracilibacillus ureilyticus]